MQFLSLSEQLSRISKCLFYCVLLSTLRMDENNDGTLTEEEFLKGCLQDDELSKMLAPNVSG